MNEHSGTTRSTDPSSAQDAARRLRRIDALQRAHRALEILQRETERAVRAGIDREYRRSGDRTGGPGRATPVVDPSREDLDRLMAIHRGLQRERFAARRPFHRHSDRLVLALELAERLALERLGYADFADFESHHGDGRPDREVIDLALIEQAERDLAEAEATLAELDREDDARGTQVLLPMWTNSPDRRWVAPRRATRTRRLVFGARRDAGAIAPDSASRLPQRRTASGLPRRLVPASGLPPATPLPVRLPRRHGAPDRPAGATPRGRRGAPDLGPRRGDDHDVLDLDELILAGLEVDLRLPDGASPTDRARLDRPTGSTTTGRTTDRPAPGSSRPESERADGEGPDDRVLGEIVHNGRNLRVEKIGGLVYDDDDDDPGAGAITYGDPNRPD